MLYYVCYISFLWCIKAIYGHCQAEAKGVYRHQFLNPPIEDRLDTAQYCISTLFVYFKKRFSQTKSYLSNVLFLQECASKGFDQSLKPVAADFAKYTHFRAGQPGMPYIYNVYYTYI